MWTDIISEILDRIVGIFFFVVAVGLTLFIISQMDTSVTTLKSDYANDRVYSEAALAVTDESTVSRDELIAFIMNCPNKNVTVKDTVSNYVIDITSGFAMENSVRIAEGSSLNSNMQVINFGYNRWDNKQLQLFKWLKSENYKMKNITDTSGKVKSVMFITK